jgi:hypothetical protein
MLSCRRNGIHFAGTCVAPQRPEGLICINQALRSFASPIKQSQLVNIADQVLAKRRTPPEHQQSQSSPPPLLAKRHRYRARDGRVLIRFEPDPRLHDLLIRTYWLTNRAAGDRGTIRQALAAMLKDAARS